MNYSIWLLSRLINCGLLADATDIFRVTSESPFLFFEPVEEAWEAHQKNQADATFMDDVIDGCASVSVNKPNCLNLFLLQPNAALPPHASYINLPHPSPYAVDVSKSPSCQLKKEYILFIVSTLIGSPLAN